MNNFVKWRNERGKERSERLVRRGKDQQINREADPETEQGRAEMSGFKYH